MAPVVMACALMCAALATVGLLAGDAAARPQQAAAYVPVMAPADGGEVFAGTEFEQCDDLQGQSMKFEGNGRILHGASGVFLSEDRNYTYADDYCVAWYKAERHEPPNLLLEPDQWLIWYLDKSAAETFSWWIGAPDPIIGDAGQSKDETTKAERDNGKANARPVNFGKEKFMILVVAFSAAGVIISLILVARSGDPSAAKRSVRGPAYAVLALALTVPLINANVKASDAFSKWIITTGLPDASGRGGRSSPERVLQMSIRDFLSSFDDENFILKFIFLSGLVIATLVLYLEGIFRLFVVITAAATLPVMASLSGTNHGREFLRRTIAVIVPLCWLDTVQAIGMVFPLQILDAHRDAGESGIQTGFICLFGIVMVCFMPGALIRITAPIASEVASSGAMNRRFAEAIPATGARVVGGALRIVRPGGN